MLSRLSSRTRSLLDHRLHSSCRIKIRGLGYPYVLDAKYRTMATRQDEQIRKPQRIVRFPIETTTLGKRADVIIVKEFPPHLPDALERKPNLDEISIDGSRFLLDQIGENSLERTDVGIESLSNTYKPCTKLSDSEYKVFRDKLQSSFTVPQLEAYYKSTRLGPDTFQLSSSSQWIPGTSLYIEPSIGSETVGSRVIRAQGLKNKLALAEKILRDCWQLGIETEIGQLDIRLPVHHLALLMRSKHFSFEELASLNDAAIDVMQTKGFLRITGKQRSCEAVAEMIQDVTARIRSESIDLPNHKGDKTAGHVLNPEFLSWVQQTYAISFVNGSSQSPEQLFYLAEDKEQAENARRTLHLAVRKAHAHPVPFSTYMPASEQIHTHDVNLKDTASWPNRKKPWFRWQLSSTPTKSKSPSEFFFNTSQVALSDELWKFLQRKGSASAKYKSVPSISESITASIGKCVFVRPPSPSPETDRVSASELGRLSFPRTFVKDVPRAGILMRSLTPMPTKPGVRTHRVRLVPAASHAELLPELELEIASAMNATNGSADQCVIRSAKAILEEKSVDYLVPEATSDIRFTRNVTHDLLAGPQELYSLETVQAGLRRCLLKDDTPSAVPLPISASITLPSYLVQSADKAPTLGDSVTAEYLYLPVSDAQAGTLVYEYGFQNRRLLFSVHDGGPFDALRTDNLFLEMGPQSENDSAASTKSPQEEFKSFYTSACALSFELDLV